MAGAGKSVGVGPGDRALFVGRIGPTGKQCDVLSVRPVFAAIRLDSGTALLCLTADLHPVPRRPPPMW